MKFNYIQLRKVRNNKQILYYLYDKNLNGIYYANKFLDAIKIRIGLDVSPNTLKTYAYQLRYLYEFLQSRDLTEVNLDNNSLLLSDFKLWLLNPLREHENVAVIYPDQESKELSVTTINAIISRSSSFCKWLTDTNVIRKMPNIYRNIPLTNKDGDRMLLVHTKRRRTQAINVLKERNPKKAVKIISDSDFKTIIETQTSLRNKLIYYILKEGGLRSGELLGLRIEDINYGESGLNIVKRSNKNDARAKNSHIRERFVHLPYKLLDALDQYVASEWIRSSTDSDFLFVNTSTNNPMYLGQPMKKHTLDSIFKYASFKTGIKHTPHMLRHYVEYFIMLSDSLKLLKFLPFNV